MSIVDSSGARIFWNASGTGDPILLIMGLGYAHQMWFRTRPVLDAKFTTIAFDNRGVGASDVPPGPYPIPQMAADAAAVMSAAGVDRAHVYGVSMGGMIAQQFALDYPDRVNQLILGCTASGGPNAVRAKDEVIKVLMARATMTPDEGAEAMVPYIYDASTPRARIEEDLTIRRSIYPTGEGYTAQVQGIMAWTCFDRLGEIKAPTLVIHGETDELVPPGNGRLIASRIPGAELVMIPHASHLYTTDQPKIADQAILDFLK
jgi:3-oxoadipate enol-lactonase